MTKNQPAEPVIELAAIDDAYREAVYAVTADTLGHPDVQRAIAAAVDALDEVGRRVAIVVERQRIDDAERRLAELGEDTGRQ
jgi:hypothetical protein